MKTKEIFAIFGNPVSHSMSPLIHNSAFGALGVDACYARYRLEDGSMLRSKFFELGLKGANITVPHKETAYKACDVVDEFAKKVGAVNTIVQRDGLLHGYNTDAPGFLKVIEEFEAKSILFLGAGGTARSTANILRDNGYRVTILNRSSNRLEQFIKEGFGCYTYDNFTPDNYDLIVNMTSAGLSDDALPAPKSLLDSIIPHAKACIDVVYGKQTPFLRLANSYTKETKDGKDMLIYQGALAFEQFTDNRYSFEEIMPHMKRVFEF